MPAFEAGMGMGKGMGAWGGLGKQEGDLLGQREEWWAFPVLDGQGAGG